MNRKFYITTSIAYTNASPHLGFALELIQADVLARYHRALGQDVFFLTGTDEHGAKVVKAAEAAGKKPEDFTNELSGKFRQLAQILKSSNNEFVRTTDREKHWPAVQKVWRKMEKNGDLYKKNYRGFYCSGCEVFITGKDLAEGKCKIHQREPERIEEENYFFRLSKYSQKIEKLIEGNKIKIVPESRKKEILNFVKDGLEDVSFSRPRADLKWGIPVPDDETQTIYVWADALTNYLSAIGYSDSDSPEYWPADIHFIGKDILKFHAAIWPGMLLSLGEALPKTIFVHGFITVAGQKMSKSLGNVIDPFELVAKYGADSVRYFLLREIPPAEDGDFTLEKFEKRYNSDLAGGLGNLAARVVTLARNFNISVSDKFFNSTFPKSVKRAKKDCDHLLSEFKFNEALAKIWELISECDRYINEQKPWQESKAQKKVIGDLLSVIGEIAKLLGPFLPETSEKIIKQLKMRKSEPLFPRFK